MDNPRLRNPEYGGVEEHVIFEYLQEVYCFESDTFVCAGFDDPSKDTAQRPKREVDDEKSSKSSK